MYNTYISSTVAFRSKASLYYSLNDHHHYLSSNTRRVDDNNSSCTCCAFPFHMTPTCVYGLRQSTLIHFSASRRLTFGGGPLYFRFSVNDFDPVCYANSYLETSHTHNHGAIKSKERRGRKLGRKFGCMGWEENCETSDMDGINKTAEAMLSLLTEQVDDRFLGAGKRNGTRSGVRAVKRENASQNVSELYREEDKYAKCDRSKRSSKEKLTNVKAREEDKYVESDYLHMNSKGKPEIVNAKSREEEYRWSGVREGSLKDENGCSRKQGSSCSSSYYSAVSSGEIFESDEDVQFNHESFAGESLSSNKNMEMRRGDGVSVGSATEQSIKYEDDVREKNKEVTIQGTAEMGSRLVSIDSDWGSRNEREKKRSKLSVHQIESRKQSSQNFSNVLEIPESGSETPSIHKKRFSDREGYSTSSGEMVGKSREHFRQTGDLVIQRAGSRRKSREFTEQSEMRDSELERASSSLTQFKGREDKLTESVDLNQEAREKHRLTSHSRQNESTRKSQQRSTLLLQAKEKHSQTDELVQGTLLKKRSQDPTKISVTNVSDTRTVTDTQKLFITGLNTKENRLASTIDSVEEGVEGQTLAGGRVVCRTSEELQRPIRLSSFSESSAEKSSGSQEPFGLVQKAAELPANGQKENRTSDIMRPPPSQFVKRTSQESSQKPTSRYATQEASYETLGNESTAVSTEERAPNIPILLDGGTRKDKIHGEHSEVIFPDDALGSTKRLEESSSQFVGEFSEKLRHETASYQTTAAHQDKKYTQQDSSQQVSNEFHSQVHGSRRSSFGSGARGPTDEMWDVAGPSSQDPSRIESPGEATLSTGSAIIKSSRSVWSVLADIVRLRWGAHSEIHKSTMNSGVKSSSNESMGSEVWFSSHEPDNKDYDNSKKGKKGMPKVDISADQPFHGMSLNENERDASKGMVSDNRIIKIETDVSSSATVECSSADKDVSSAPREEISGPKDIKRDQGVPSSISTADSSLPLSTRRLIRSPPVVEEIPESIKAEASSSGLMEIAEPVKESPSEASRTEGKDAELKQRKLQRNKQVLRERFGEWEEAYRLESEQRKLDETFMREALLEAKRAADTWEVPVGAVLVQDGKIIARGCNLVEELRDSTAHAEMICIREASNLLRTWRLAETTLYVTLEPCAMCAGAILQARIDTVVWGAPNKLLGADGSWVRLFPNGGEGGGGSDLSNQASGPVHPFHPKITIRRGILSAECADVMQQFFQLRRKKEKKPNSAPTSGGLPTSKHPLKFISKLHDIFSIMFCM